MKQFDITSLILDVAELDRISLSKFLPTTNNFCGNYANDTVRCSAHWDKEDQLAYFHVQGNDDLCYTKQIQFITLSGFIIYKATYYDKLTIPITIDYLLSIGFVQR